MNCLKCGRETNCEQVFCDDCLLEMEKYPVRPGTLVHLPRHKETSVVRMPAKRRAPPLEDQVKLMRKMIRRLTLALFVCILLILAMAYPAISYFQEEHFAIGQNYHYVAPTSAAPSGNAAD